MEIKKFANKIKFWQYIYEMNNGLDFGNTIKLPNFWFYFEGQKYVTSGISQTLDKLNELCHTRFDSKTSIAVGNRVTLFEMSRFDLTAEDAVEKNTEVLEDEAVDNVPLISLESETSLLETLSTDKEDNTPDWDHVADLYDDSDKRGSKDRLEEYARHWDIELNKNITFAKMVKEFKAAL